MSTETDRDFLRGHAAKVLPREVLDASHRGQSCIPMGKDKKPLVKWKPYQTRLPTIEEMIEWAENLEPSGWAGVTGAMAGRIVLDDDAQRWLREFGLDPHVRTPSGGGHCYVEHPGWYVKTLNSRSCKKLGETYPGLDIRADGGYAVLCGYEEKGGYTHLRELIPEPLDRLPHEAREFFGLLEAPRVELSVLVERAMEEMRASGRNNGGFWLACQCRDNGYNQAEALSAGRDYVPRTPAKNMKGEVEPYTLDDYRASVDQAYGQSPRQPWTAKPASGQSNGKNGKHPDRPVIIVTDRPLRDQTEQALAAIIEANKPPRIFVRSGELARVRRDEESRPLIDTVSERILRRRLADVADFYTVSRNNQEHVSPPMDVVQNILAAGEWAFPKLTAVVESPVLRPDGSILATPGYDPATHLVFQPAPGFQLPPIPAKPTQDEARAAINYLRSEPLEGFRFASDADLANALGELITPIIRQSVRGNVPLAVVESPKAGSGKGLYSALVAQTATGRPAALMSAPRDDEEWRKAITAALLTGATVILIDNVEGRLDAPSLSRALTAAVWSDRLLGTNQQLELPQRASWIANGNNLRLGKDIPRRCFRIRLDPQVPRPWLRTGFKHPDLLAWARQERPTLLAHLLTLCRAWIVAGRPTASSPVLGSFEDWSRTVGGILAHAGVEKFLGNLDEMYAEMDDNTPQWEAFLVAWAAYLGKKEVTSRDIAQAVDANDAFQEALPDELALARARSPAAFVTRIGYALKQQAEVRYGPVDLRLLKDDGIVINCPDAVVRLIRGTSRRNVALWRLAIARAEGAPGGAGTFSSPNGSHRHELQGLQGLAGTFDSYARAGDESDESDSSVARARTREGVEVPSSPCSPCTSGDEPPEDTVIEEFL